MTNSQLVFTRMVVVALLAGVVLGFAVFMMSGATTDRGTAGAIRAERTLILEAEHLSCRDRGSYARISTLRREGFLHFRPIYNSVVIIPGSHCGTVVVGSPQYQSSGG